MLKEKEWIRFRNYHLQFCIAEEVRIVLISDKSSFISVLVVDKILLPEENLP